LIVYQLIGLIPFIMGGKYSINDVYDHDPSVLFWKPSMEEIGINECDLCQFYQAFKKIRKKYNVMGQECLTLVSILDYVGVDPVNFMTNALSIFKPPEKRKIKTLNFCDFCFALWIFCTLDEESMRK